MFILTPDGSNQVPDLALYISLLYVCVVSAYAWYVNRKDKSNKK
jgi:hypothetical protein